MGIGVMQTDNYQTENTSYSKSMNQKVNEFYSDLSQAVEKSDSKGTDEVLGLTTIPYSDSKFYGMVCMYSQQSTDEDPIIRVSSNYGGEQRYYDVHVNEVNPYNASMLEMFALSCYQDDQGITNRGTYGSFTRMKAYRENAADLGYDVSGDKMDWVSMLNYMADVYVQQSETYTQYMDCQTLADKLKNKDYLMSVIHNKISDLASKIERGETEPTYQIGKKSFTDKEWNKMIDRVDDSIESIKKQQKEREEKLKKEELEEKLDKS